LPSHEQVCAGSEQVWQAQGRTIPRKVWLVHFHGSFGAYGDVHDYLHTVIGASISWDDEKRVLAIESAIEHGEVPVPRGLDVAS